MEETLRRGILGRRQSCDSKRIDILSDTIECNYSSRYTSSLLHSKSWKIENWRSFVWKTILVSSTTTKDLIETRSQLDQREWSIGFYSWTNSQLGNSFNSLLEKHFVLNFPNQPNPNPIQSVIDWGNLRTQNVFLWRKENRPFHKRLLLNGCNKNSWLFS